VKTAITIAVDTAKEDMGVTEVMEAHRAFLALPGMRVRVAQGMTTIFRNQTIVSRQMLEKWMRQENRITPSTRMFLAFLLAVRKIEQSETEKVK
jgi:hypothetical protein